MAVRKKMYNYIYYMQETNIIKSTFSTVSSMTIVRDCNFIKSHLHNFLESF